LGGKQAGGIFMRREFSAGGVVFKKIKGESSNLPAGEAGVKLLWLVAKSKPSKEYPDDVWRLPKGWLDDERGGKKPGQLATGSKRASANQIIKAAIKEVAEEGGVEVKVISKIATDNYFYTDKEKSKVAKFVTYFLMEWQRNLKEGFGEETEDIEWLEYKKARERLTYPREKNILEKANEILGAGVQENLI